MSLQEEQARQAASSTSTSQAAALEPVPEGVNTQITDPTGGASIPSNPSVPSETVKSEEAEEAMMTGEEGEEDEDEELRRALLLSTQEGGEEDDTEMGSGTDEGGEGLMEDEDEDAAMQRASE